MTFARRPAWWLLTCLAFTSPLAARAETPAPMRATPEMLRAPATHPAPGFQAEGLEAVFYDGLPWKGRPTKVFAWIGMPKVEPGRKVPGIVLVHGGGGTAYEAWARLWVGRGYAAIAMDTVGAVPAGGYVKGPRHADAGPPGPDFSTADEPAEDQWPYHAAADVILADSLLRSRPEVDPERIGITGISWGGYLTCVVSGLDDRLKFAAPVYGCGFLGDDSAWSGEIAKLGDRGQHWLARWDPSHYLPAGTMPKLWVTGTNDFAYPLDSLQKSYRVAGGRSTLCVRLRMPHGHGAVAEAPEEIHAFADSVVNGGSPLNQVDATTREGDQVRVAYRGATPVAKAELLWTKDSGPWTARVWEAAEAKVNPAAKAVSAQLPPGTTTYYLNLQDEKGRVVSTEHVVVAGP